MQSKVENNFRSGAFVLLERSFMHYPFRSLTVVLATLISGLAETIGLLTILPLLNLGMASINGGISGESSGSSISSIEKIFIDIFSYFGLTPTLELMLGIIVAAMLIKGILVLVSNTHVGYVTAHVATDLRLQLINALLHASWSHFTSQSVGRFSNAISSEATRASTAHLASWNLIAASAQIVIFLLASFMVSWQVTLASMGVGVFIIFSLGWATKMARKAGANETKLLNALVSRLTDSLQGIKPLKAMGLESQVMPMLVHETEDLSLAHQKQALASASLTALPEPVMVTVLAIGVYVIVTFTDMAITNLIILALLFNRSVGRFSQVQKYLQMIASSETALWSIQSAIDTALHSEVNNEGKLYPKLEKEIELKNVKFSYGDVEVINDLSINIPAFEVTVFTGASGCGKTTTVDMICGLLIPDQGEIKVDGIPLASVNMRDWRHSIGYVPQELFLFHDTIYNNVTLGNDSLTRDDVQLSLERAGAWGFISMMPDGMDTVIGERGSKLSGGQRQRLTIARAIVRCPELLILDEATTALDPQTESEICETINKLKETMTIIAISHQPTIRSISKNIIDFENVRLKTSKNSIV